MADVQTENGFTAIANELLEALARIRIPGEARQVLDVILRKTYGYKKTEDRISLSQFCLATGMSKTRVCQALNKLLNMKLITKKGNALGNSYRINKDFDTWKPLPKKETLPKKEMTITKKGNNHYQKQDIQKKVLKETITKEKELMLISEFESFWAIYPKKVKKKDALKAWLKIKPDEELLNKISDALKQQKKSADWIKEKGKYIPYPASWLNGERWNDIITTTGGQKNGNNTTVGDYYESAQQKYAGVGQIPDAYKSKADDGGGKNTDPKLDGHTIKIS